MGLCLNATFFSAILIQCNKRLRRDFVCAKVIANALYLAAFYQRVQHELVELKCSGQLGVSMLSSFDRQYV